MAFGALALACSSSSGTNNPPPADTGTPPDDVVADVPVDAPVDTAADGRIPCSSARDTAYGPIDSVSSGEVKTLDDTGGVKTLYVDASAGGMSAEKTNPRVYISLATGARVDITDKEAFGSTAWDLAIKRAYLHTNSGDGGPGGGGARFLAGKAFDSVAMADATSLKTEVWFDKDCNVLRDAIGGIKTTFDAWYVYDSATSKLAPAAGTWVLRGAKGDFYKLELQGYYSNPDGTAGATSGRYKLRYAALK